MTLKIADRIFETSTTTGTGNLTMGGAVSGFQGFSVIGTGIKTPYYIDDADNTGIAQNWEAGIGTVTVSGGITTLSRDTVLASSNSNIVVNFGVGTKNVRGGIPAAMLPVVDESLNSTRQSAINTTGSTANAIAIALGYTPLAYTDGMEVDFKVPITNTTAGVTLNVGGKGAKALKFVGADPGIGALVAGQRIFAKYNATTDQFDILNLPAGWVVPAANQGSKTVADFMEYTAVYVENGTQYIVITPGFAFTITGVSYYCASGSCTVTVTNDSVGNIFSSLAVSTTGAQNNSPANATVGSSGAIYITISSNASAKNLILGFRLTRVI